MDSYGNSNAAFALDTPTFVPSDPEAMAYVDELRRRRSLIYGGWPEMARARVLRRLGTVRTDVLGDADLSSNTFSATMSALAVLYSEAPTITNSVDPSAVEDMTHFVRKAGLWPRMQRYQRDCLAMREMLLRVDVVRESRTGDPLRDLCARYRPVFPDLCELTPDPEQPERPIAIVEYRRRPLGGSRRWTKETWSLADGVPTHRVSDGTVDISKEYGLPELGAFGDDYPTRYRRSDGRPVLPYVLHHAALTGSLLDSFHGIELVEGTLEVAVDWTYFHHVLRNAAFGKIVAIGCRPVALGVEGSGGTARQAGVSDPAVVHEFEVDPNYQGQASVTMLSQSVSAVDVGEAISIYERKIATFAGIDPSEIQRISGDPRSGYAIALSTEGKRQAALRYAPVFAYADAETLALTAIMLNRELGAEVYPEEGWGVEYAGIGPVLDASAPATAGAPAAGALQDTALNGAQVDSLVGVIASVAARQLPRDAGVAIIRRSFGVSAEDAESMVGEVGRSFFAPTPAA